MGIVVLMFCFDRTLAITKTELNQKQEVAEAVQKELQDLLAKQTAQTSELKKMTEKLKVLSQMFVSALFFLFISFIYLFF